ncbi:hypothetical protein N7468_002952 [Penicillium chermesinum]|uniref:AB hydrolase-1 domain-containing protein n=1 Tax=Penicillium chermesinum TaxID=63820 RepID=A0A9W9P871_9EURO|nr:uncharacterized protein N7468_002952 [Penicillium chermesinum]KAJ5238333.1 hypothetical protein N7468_002952 [Penicillium chermesinum]KAJ6164001.1 hypothetical protein N7470_002673 [Penicillium chermesinum]
MATTYDVKLPLQRESLQTIGLLKKGKPVSGPRPLVVFLHGAGSNASYFDNRIYSYPQKLSELGHPVLNVQRPAYGGTPVPATTKPLQDSIPLITDLINQAYQEHAGGKGGIVIIGHSAGAAVAVAIAAQPDSPLPIVGLSVLGLVPVEQDNLLIPRPDPDPENPRLSAEHMPPSASEFMGPLQYLNGDVFGNVAMIKTVFEPLSRPEIREYPGSEWHNLMVNNYMPAIKVPVQYLATEYEGIWTGKEAGQPIFDYYASRFVNSPEVEAKILSKGGHSYDFSLNAGELHELRLNFIAKVVSQLVKGAPLTLIC